MAQTGQDLGKDCGFGVWFVREEMRAYFNTGLESLCFCAGCMDYAGAVGGGDYWLFEGEAMQRLEPEAVVLVSSQFGSSGCKGNTSAIATSR